MADAMQGTNALTLTAVLKAPSIGRLLTGLHRARTHPSNVPKTRCSMHRLSNWGPEFAWCKRRYARTFLPEPPARPG